MTQSASFSSASEEEAETKTVSVGVRGAIAESSAVDSPTADSSKSSASD
jgi:hypothetical protein